MTSSTPHLTVFYELNPYDLTNNTTFAGGSGELWKHRTLDKLPPTTAVDLRLISDPTAFQRPLSHPLSKVLILGENALNKCLPDLQGSINQHRGYVLSFRGRPAIATYAPIDCWQLYSKSTSSADDDDDDDDAASDDKDIANTKRSNYLYWSFADFWKLVNLPTFVPFSVPLRYEQIDTNLLSITAKLRQLRLSLTPADLVLDIETRMQDHSVDVIGLHFNKQPHVAIIYNSNNDRCDGRLLAAFWRELYLTFLSPHITVIGHNLAFDLSVLCLTWKLPIPKSIYDTMLAMHRESPLAEKSLSHAISFYLPATRNHKGDICPNVSAANLQQLIIYNANDIVTTAELAAAQRLKHAADEGLSKAVTAANNIQRVTLLMSLTGIRIDEEKLIAAKQQQELAAEQYTRICRLLTGHPNFNPNSSQQKANFFYNQLHYPVVETTKTGAPAAGAKALYKMQVKQNNPLIPFIIAAVEAGKAASMMEFRRKKAII